MVQNSCRTESTLTTSMTKKRIAGGGSGIGRATCQLLARDGARVVVTDVDLRAARETQSLMSGKNKTESLHLLSLLSRKRFLRILPSV